MEKVGMALLLLGLGLSMSTLMFAIATDFSCKYKEGEKISFVIAFALSLVGTALMAIVVLQRS
jgi:hypothetical protein